MTTDKKKALKQELVVENDKVKELYASHFRKITKSFETRGIEVNEIKQLLLSKLPKAFPGDNSLPSLIMAAPTLGDLFVILANHCSWFNHRQFEFIIDELGNGEEKYAWLKYKKEVLKPHLQRSLFKIPSTSFSTATSDAPLCRLQLKLVDDIDLSGNEVFVIKDKLSELLEVPVLELSSYDVGSVLLVFTIPKDIFNLYPQHSALHQYIAYDEDTDSYYIRANITTIL